MHTNIQKYIYMYIHTYMYIHYYDLPPQGGVHTHQTLLFSATVPSWVQSVARKYLRKDKRVDIDLVIGETLKTAAKVLNNRSGEKKRLKQMRNNTSRWAFCHGETLVCSAGRTFTHSVCYSMCYSARYGVPCKIISN